MNLVQLLSEQARAQPDAPALIDCGQSNCRTVTFADLDHAAQKRAAFLEQLGLCCGDRVLVFLPISLDLYVALAAVFRLGLVAMFVDPSVGRAHIERCCELGVPSAFLGTPKAHLLRFVSPTLRRIPVQICTSRWIPGAHWWRRRRRLGPRQEVASCEAHTPALTTFTSGSTGPPKMVVRSHGFLLHQHAVIEETLGLSTGEVILTTLPIFILSHLGAGLCTLIPRVDIRHPGRVEPEPLVRQIEELGVTCIEASPAFVDRLVQYCLASGHVLPGVHKILMGGAPVFPDLMEQAQRIAPQATVTAVYGSTEAEPIAHLNYQEISETDQQSMRNGAGLLAGRTVEAVQLRILPDQWGTPLEAMTETAFVQECLPSHQAGEIVVSGRHVLQGYWRGFGDQDSKFHVGETVWHRTGDAGYIDGDGRLWLLGRCAARIDDEHGALYPFAAENAAHQFAAVRHAAFVHHGALRVLVVETHGKAPANLEFELRDALAWAHVGQVRIVGRMPVDPRHNAKVDYRALHRLLD